MHPTATVTIYRPTFATKPGGARVETVTTVGSFEAGIEDIGAELRKSPGGENVKDAARTYAGRALDVGAIPSDLAAYTCPMTGRQMKLTVKSRVGPFDATDAGDHFELELIDSLEAPRI